MLDNLLGIRKNTVIPEVLSPHGRASDTATGVSRMAPDRIVVQYSGDGDACGIGLAGLMHACNRRENFIVVIYNNNAYGMTGGQMGPTTTKEVPTTTFQGGRDEEVMGHPMDIIKTLAHFPGVVYAGRCALPALEGVRSYGVPVFQLARDGGAPGLANMGMLGLYNLIAGHFTIDELLAGMEDYLPVWRHKLLPGNRAVLEAVSKIDPEEYRVS